MRLHDAGVGAVPGDVGTPEARDGDRARRVRRRTLAAFVLAAVGLVGVPVAASRLIDRGAPAAHVFEIPLGTGRRVLAGEDVAVLPADLRIPLRDRLVVVNHDDQTHQVGPFTVAPGETLDRRFSEAVSLVGYCSLHPGGRISIDVRPAG